MITRLKKTTARKRAEFVVVSMVLVGVWTLVLPRLGQIDSMRQIIDRNQAASIDPSALFYSDLEHLQYKNGLLRRDR
tara:strand:+ start:28686 stop:28916 length:231 start_codon:yes stop_codon:yes gene_type:complete